jgi:hypothetical protein
MIMDIDGQKVVIIDMPDIITPYNNRHIDMDKYKKVNENLSKLFTRFHITGDKNKPQV